jgi:hypothetical protein
MFVVWVVFAVWSLKCLLFEEKKVSDKENLLLPIPIYRFKDANSMLLENNNGTTNFFALLFFELIYRFI